MNARPTSLKRDSRRPMKRGMLLPWVAGAALAASLLLATGCKEKEAQKQADSSTSADTAMRYVEAPTSSIVQPVVQRFVAADHPAPKPTEALPEQTTCVTPQCHAVFGAADRIHGPLAAGDCFSCHDRDLGGHAYPLLRPGNDTCTFCHQVGNSQMHRHEALDESGCLGCHDPHAGRKFLLVENSVDQLCEKCHAPDEGKHPHGPYAEKECAACHQPHESNNAGLLRGGEASEFCYTCHAQTKYVMANALFVHDPARKNCMICHDSHTSDFEKHLNKPIEQLCLDCHTGLGEAINGASTPHAAVFTGESCANCHDPHASGRPKLLRDRQTTLCLSCHNQPVKAEDGRMIPDMTASVSGKHFLHGPVESGDCSACHNVHGSTHTRLLKQDFPTGFYANFDLADYALCFGCHPKDLVISQKTTSLTDFRDGDRNLHFLHVNRDEKGRSCKTCHAIHGSDLPLHVAAAVPFDNSPWLMPIGFERLPDGGKCAPGCHVAMTYHRTPDESAAPSGAETRPGDQP